MLGTEKNKVFAADYEPMVCESCTEIPEKEAPLARYAVALNMGKCIGCRMCMIDCAAHHAEAKDGPIVYPRSWDLLPKAGLAVDVDGPCLATCPFALMPADKEGRAAQKCERCAERLEEGTDPVCVQVCPRGALSLKEVPGSVASREEKRRLLTLIN